MMVRTAVAFAAFFVLAGSAVAQPAVTRQVSPAGLPFRHVHVPDDPHQAIAFAWKDGSAVTLPGKEALSMLGAALMMEGPKGTTASVMLEQMRDLQASGGLAGGVNYTQGHLSAPKAKFPDAVRLLARVLAEPALPEERLALMRKNRTAFSRQAGESAETLAQRLMSRLALGDGPYYRSLSTEPSIFERVTLADIEAWRRSILVRDGMVVVAAGPLDAGDAGRELDRLFAGLPQSGEQPSPPMPTVRSPGRLIVLEKPVVQTAITAAGSPALAVTPETVRAELALAALGGGVSGRLFKAVRDRLGAAYNIGAALVAVGPKTRVVGIRTVVANDKAKDAVAAIRDEYARFIMEGLTEAEIDPLKSMFVSRHGERIRRAPSLASAVLGSLLSELPDDALATFEARVRGIDRAAVNDDIRTRLPKPPLTFVVIAPSAEGFGADCVIKAADEIARCE